MPDGGGDAFVEAGEGDGGLIHGHHSPLRVRRVGSLGLSFRGILDINAFPRIYCSVKTTVDLPDSILERTKIAAAKRRTSIKSLIIEGLEKVLSEEAPVVVPNDALARLRKGYHLGGKPLSRDEVHAR